MTEKEVLDIIEEALVKAVMEELKRFSPNITSEKARSLLGLVGARIVAGKNLVDKKLFKLLKE